MESHTAPHESIPVEDAGRLARLSEEIRSRLFEIADITARLGGNVFKDGHVVKYTPREARARTDEQTHTGDWVEIIEVDGYEACYGVIGGHPFAVSPCV